MGTLIQSLRFKIRTALHEAVYHSCVQQLRGVSGLDWNWKDYSRETPLLTAACLLSETNFSGTV